MLAAFNRRGAFDNLTDTESGLRGVLAQSFEHAEIETVGSIAMFAATDPRAQGRVASVPEGAVDGAPPRREGGEPEGTGGETR